MLRGESAALGILAGDVVQGFVSEDGVLGLMVLPGREHVGNGKARVVDRSVLGMDGCGFFSAREANGLGAAGR